MSLKKKSRLISKSHLTTFLDYKLSNLTMVFTLPGGGGKDGEEEDSSWDRQEGDGDWDNSSETQIKKAKR